MLKTIPGHLDLGDHDIPTLRHMLVERKKAMTAAQSGPGVPADVAEEDTTIPARDGYKIPIRIYRPKASPPASGSPLIVFLHGGGFCLGGLENEELNCRLFVQRFGAVAVNVDYRLAPEHPFPTPTRDSWDAVKWVAANAEKIGANPSKGFIVGGTSAGANQAIAISLLARDEKLSPPLTGVAALIPPVMDHEAIPDEYKDEVISYKQNENAPILGLKAVEMFMSNYKPDLQSSEYNIFAPGTKHSNLPPTFLQVCG
jgi:acetyl esterase/lipase